MAMKDQWTKIKENWLLIVAILVLMVVFSGAGQNIMNGASYSLSGGGVMMEKAYDSRMASPSAMYYPSYDEGFAPDVQERIITKTVSLSTEVEKGTFSTNEVKLRSVITTSDGFILNENVNKYGTDRNEYTMGYYSIKVDTRKLDAVVSQLKEIGEVQSYSENANDITGSYVSLEDQLKTEQDRLERFEKMLEDAKEVSDKIELSDRIFNQERTISYLEDRLENMDLRVDYSTVSFSMQEKQSDYANVVFVKFSELVRSLVNSASNLFKFAFVALPWAIAAFVVWLFYRIFKRKRK